MDSRAALQGLDAESESLANANPPVHNNRRTGTHRRLNGSARHDARCCGGFDMAKAKSTASPATVYQFKITLQYIKPPIWRRVQVADGTLDGLHEHIQN